MAAAAGLVLLAAGIGLVRWIWPGMDGGETGSSAVSEKPSNTMEARTTASAASVEQANSEEQGPQAETARLKREAVEAAGAVAAAFPNDSLAFALLGSAFYNTGQSEEAVKHLRRCVELNPGLGDAYDIMGRVAYDKGRLEEAVGFWRQAMERSPGGAEVLNRLGRALMDLGETEEAVRILEKAAGLPRPTSESFYLLGQAAMQAGDYGKAKEQFQKATRLMPDHTQAYFGLYTACARLGQAEEAERFRQQFEKLEAADRRTLTDRGAGEDALSGLPLVRRTVARTLFGAGQILGGHGQSEKAIGHFRRAALLDGESPVYRAALESVFVKGNTLPAGVAFFQELAAEQAENSWNFFFLGRLQGRLDQFEAAEKSFLKAQQLAPQWAEGYRALAELSLRLERGLPQARQLAQKAVELEPSGGSYYLLAVACAKNRDRAGALSAVREALLRNPGEARYERFRRELEGAP